MRARRRWQVLAVLTAGVISPAAAEATVSVVASKTTDRWEISDTTGAADLIIVTGGTTEITIESSQPFGTVEGCAGGSTSPSGRPRRHCSDPTIEGITANLGAGNDDWSDLRNGRYPAAGAVVVNGGLGGDVIRGGNDDELLSGDEGDDHLSSGTGFDSLRGGAGADSLTDQDAPTTTSGDVLNGGLGNDFLIVRGGNDQARGEAGSDTIHEEDHNQVRDTIDGGTETDKFASERPPGLTIQDTGPSANVFRDLPLRQNAELEESPLNFEAFEGTNGPDVINAALRTATTARTYNGRGGADVVVSGSGGDVIVGGNGRDVLKGGAGDDVLDAKAGEGAAVPDEQLECGPGNDSASIDLLDPDPTGCETISRSAIGEGPHIRIGAVRHVRDRTGAVRVRCPRRLAHRCRGTLELALTPRGLRAANARRYSIRAGHRRTLRVQLTRGTARRLRRSPRRRGVVRSTENGDVAGKKTTLAHRKFTR